MKNNNELFGYVIVCAHPKVCVNLDKIMATQKIIAIAVTADGKNLKKQQQQQITIFNWNDRMMDNKPESRLRTDIEIKLFIANGKKKKLKTEKTWAKHRPMPPLTNRTNTQWAKIAFVLSIKIIQLLCETWCRKSTIFRKIMSNFKW